MSCRTGDHLSLFEEKNFLKILLFTREITNNKTSLFLIFQPRPQSNFRNFLLKTLLENFCRGFHFKNYRNYAITFGKKKEKLSLK